jgi:hypothetical protein
MTTNTKTKASSNLITKADKEVLSSYIFQSYKLKEYTNLKSKTKEIAEGIFAKAKINLIVVDEKSFVQKIERTQRRFDSTKFVEYVLQSNDKKLIALINQFYKTIDTLELKPVNADFDTQLKTNGGINA